MNWSNLDLEDAHERNANILDAYNIDTLLLEISCNIRTENLNKEEIKKHFNNVLNLRIEECKELFNDNLNNILKQAKKERNQK